MATIEEKANGKAALPHKQIHLMGKEIFLYREVTSTNSVAQLMARSGASEGTIVLSRTQTSGDGKVETPVGVSGRSGHFDVYGLKT